MHINCFLFNVKQFIYFFLSFFLYFFFTIYRSNIKPNQKSPREILHNVLDKWEEGLGENEFISGNEKPNLADIVSLSFK
jgi:hypothetical protein